MRRNGTRPKADKPKDHEPEVAGYRNPLCLAEVSCAGSSQELHLPSNWARDGVWICLTRILALRHADPPFQAAKISLERKSADRPAPRTRASGLTTEQGLFKREGPAYGTFQCTKVLRARQSSGRGGQQLPVLGQNDCIDGVNDAVRRNDVRLGDTGSIDPNVR